MDDLAWIGWIVAAVSAVFGALRWHQGRGLNQRIEGMENLLERMASGRTAETAEAVRVAEGTSDEAALESVAERIARLPDREKLAVTLRYAEGLTPNEIGEVLGISAHKAQIILRQALAQMMIASLPPPQILPADRRQPRPKRG